MRDVQDTAAGVDAPAAGLWADRGDAPAYAAELCPNRSLSRRGQRRFVWLLAGSFCVPLLPLVATPVIWIPMAFAALAVGFMAWALGRNSADAMLVERIAVWPDEMRVERIEPSGRVLRWSADPYFVRLTLHADARPEQYLTLRGGGREIELGAFLSPDERVRLAGEIEAAIRRALPRFEPAPR
ncbi:MAG: DUF2244 domain-containing protein [Pseudomonadota bacterium]